MSDTGLKCPQCGAERGERVPVGGEHYRCRGCGCAWGVVAGTGTTYQHTLEEIRARVAAGARRE